MNEELYIAFENYLNNEMPQDERKALEEKLRNDKDIREKFELYKETTQFMSAKFDSDAIDFKNNLETISKAHLIQTKTKSKVIAFKPWYYAVAASVVIAVGIWFTGSGNPDYNDFNQHENAYFMERSSADKNLNDAQNAFNQKDYKKAIVSFERVEDLTNPELQYFYAIALIETEHYKNAELYLNNIRSGTSVYKDKATWYLALSNLKQKKFDECKTYLNQIPADAEDYEKAQKLLKDLK
jgi:predicted Zn-dependent protease